MRKRIMTTCLAIGFAIVTLSLLVESCSVKSRSDSNDLTKTSVKAERDTSISLQNASLEGVWWSSPDDIHAVFYIIGDSLYYTEEQESPYFIELENENLTLSRESVRFSFEVRKITIDSLILYDQNMNEVIKFYKSTTR